MLPSLLFHWWQLLVLNWFKRYENVSSLCLSPPFSLPSSNVTQTQNVLQTFDFVLSIIHWTRSKSSSLNLAIWIKALIFQESLQQGNTSLYPILYFCLIAWAVMIDAFQAYTNLDFPFLSMCHKSIFFIRVKIALCIFFMLQLLSDNMSLIHKSSLAYRQIQPQILLKEFRLSCFIEENNAMRMKYHAFHLSKWMHVRNQKSHRH
jgi:hypothetical protein